MRDFNKLLLALFNKLFMQLLLWMRLRQKKKSDNFYKTEIKKTQVSMPEIHMYSSKVFINRYQMSRIYYKILINSNPYVVGY